MSGCGRYAPSTSGLAHPGTLLSGLLTWLDARSRGDRLVLRLENLDVERCKPGFSAAMEQDLAWLGLDWDAVLHQDELRADHERALDHLQATGR
ncbi:MAG TPA: glutamate--tRNA ligase family protein, partial [Kofleriaceae bacterium]|nr:glutamate--tRNA ligase family protein [Kofleriaceae bacterium]